MAMLAGGDESVRNAFRATLREEPSRPNATQELDANDILEVHDLASAIERAEAAVRTPLSSPRPLDTSGLDIFDRLAAPRRSQTAQTAGAGSAAAPAATDDIAGPATPAAGRITPYPSTLRSPVVTDPPPSSESLAPVATLAPATGRLPTLAVPPPPPLAYTPLPVPVAPSSRPSVDVVDESGKLLGSVPDEDAYYQPAPRLRSLADITLENYRVESTLMMKAQSRRRTATVVFAFVMAGLAIIGAAAVLLQPDNPASATIGSSPSPVATTTISTAMTAAPAQTAAPVQTTAPVQTATPVQAAPVQTAQPATPSKPAAAKPVEKAAPGAVPVLDVNSLPSAPKRR